MEKALAELDRLLNDPDVRMDPERVWTLAGRLSDRATPVPATR
ncbi:MAG TPA: peptide chain release factor 1 [Roseomonas sp.]